jgi:molybdopterin-containing oxidoreductase family membrane subunit
MEFFVAWYSGNQYEKYAFYNRILGPYWWYWWVGMLFCNALTPQLFWFKRFRDNVYVVYFVCMCVNAGMWFERFIIIVGGLKTVASGGGYGVLNLGVEGMMAMGAACSFAGAVTFDSTTKRRPS